MDTLGYRFFWILGKFLGSKYPSIQKKPEKKKQKLIVLDTLGYFWILFFWISKYPKKNRKKETKIDSFGYSWILLDTFFLDTWQIFGIQYPSIYDHPPLLPQSTAMGSKNRQKSYILHSGHPEDPFWLFGVTSMPNMVKS